MIYMKEIFHPLMEFGTKLLQDDGNFCLEKGNTSKFIACHVVLDAMEFLEDIEEEGEVF
jgi:hypothetical protein